MSDVLTIGIPSKGRLMDATYSFFSEAGLQISRHNNNRNYTGSVKGLGGVEVQFLSASEIAVGLGDGSIHMGITGKDLIQEKTLTTTAKPELLCSLGFGRADVVVAVPKSWLDVDVMADLNDVATIMRTKQHKPIRVATKYLEITRQFFADHGVVDYRIVESLGATEGAPAAGSAEVIVDITSSGATLEANQLKVLQDGLILESQAYLVAAPAAKWSKTVREIARVLLDRIGARERARATLEVRFGGIKISTKDVDEIAKQTGGSVPYKSGETGEWILHVPQENLYTSVELLRVKGCETINVRQLEYVFERENKLFNLLNLRLN